jgi:hypothetical protein
VAEHVDAVELRVVVADEIAAAADAVLSANYIPRLCARLVTALTRLHVHNFRAKKQPGGREHVEGKGREGAEKLVAFRVVVFHGRHEMPVVSPLQPLELRAPCKARWV